MVTCGAALLPVFQRIWTANLSIYAFFFKDKGGNTDLKNQLYETQQQTKKAGLNQTNLLSLKASQGWIDSYC